MRVVVTGGAGFIGSAFVRHLFAAGGHEVVVLDALTYAGRRETLADVMNGISFIKGDITDPDAVAHALDGAGAVVHFAAESHVTRSETQPDLFEHTNVGGTRVLLDGACRTGVERFVHVSTDEVYGDAPEGTRFAEGDKHDGDDQATSAYAKSKSRADDLARSYADRLHLNVVRPTNNFGPYQFPEKAFPRWVTRVLRGESISLWGPGDQVRDWLFVEDTARAVALVLEQGPPGEVFNIGANHEPEIKNRDLAHWLMGRLHDRGARIEHQVDLRHHHDFRYSVDTTKINALGWASSGDVWAAFDRTLSWYDDNNAWWEPLVEEAERIYR